MLKKKDSADEPVNAVLYASNQTMVDKDLDFICDRKINTYSCDLYYCISNNVICGCTMVMNRILREYIINTFPEEIILRCKNHDGWTLYNAFVIGHVIYDEESRILYRQHETNVVGGYNLYKKATILGRIKNMYSKKHFGIRSRLAESLVHLYGDIMDDKMKHRLILISSANGIDGVREIINDHELRESFEKGDLLLYLKGVLRWI